MRRLIAAVAIFLMVSTSVHAAEIPADIKTAAEEIGMEYSVSPALIESICYHESRFTPNIKNASGKNYGLMQINPSFNTERMERLGVTKEGLLTVRGNILVGTDLLATLFEEYEDVGEVLLIYGGFSQAAKDRYHKKGILPAYINKVLKLAEQYEKEG